MTPIQSSRITSMAVSAKNTSKQYGRYDIIGLLGEGSMGHVYHAHDPDIDRPVALKVLRNDHLASKRHVQRFIKEAKAIGRLSHPNIVTVYDVGQDHGTIYIAMELIEGEPLNQLMKTRQFGTSQILNIGIQVAEALNYAHEKGVVHRDIKPSNLIMLDGGHIKLTDFSIAHFEDTSATQHTRTGDILGTPAFMSPEQIEGKNIDRRSDLFSLGILLYRLLVGQWPFTGVNMAALFNAISNSSPKKPIKINSAIPPSISEVIMKALEKKPEHRFQTGREMATSLQGCHTSLSAYSRIRQIRYRMCALVLIVSLIGIGGWLVSNNFSGSPQKHSMDNPKPQPRPKTVKHSSPQGTQVEVAPTPSNVQAQRSVVHISSDPANAKIYINGQPQGTTPAHLDLPMGTYELQLKLPDYYETNLLIEVNDPETMPLNFRLSPMPVPAKES